MEEGSDNTTQLCPPSKRRDLMGAGIFKGKQTNKQGRCGILIGCQKHGKEELEGSRFFAKPNERAVCQDLQGTEYVLAFSLLL